MCKWEKVKLGDVCSYISKGIAPSYTESMIDSILVLNQKCNRDNKINFSLARRNNLIKKKVPTERILKKYDILINSTGTGTAGRVAQLKGHLPHITVDGHMIIFRAINSVDPEYVGYALIAQQNKVESFAEGSTGQTEINKTRLLNETEIFLPPLKEQKRVAAILSSLDDKIEVNNQINKNLEEQAQAIFTSWFVDFEPFGGVMPSDWKEKTLEDVCSLVTKGITPKYNDSSEEIIINQKCIRDNKINLNLSRRHTPKKINEKWLQFGDVLINSTGAGTLGRAAQSFYKQDNLTVDSHVTIIRPKSEIFLYYIGLWCVLNENYFISISTGSTGQTDLPRERLKNSLLILPSQEILQKFNNIVKSIQNKIFSSQFEKENLENMRNTLLPKLMNGEMRA